jgi:hypothetical protein
MAAPTLLDQLLEAYPAPTYLVDDDVVVLRANRAGRELAAVRAGEPLEPRRGGELLRCVHSTEDREGCGHAEACDTCVLRSAVASALTIGAVARQAATLALRDPASGAVTAADVLVSASPVELDDGRMALLVVEDVGALARLRAASAAEP